MGFILLCRGQVVQLIDPESPKSTIVKRIVAMVSTYVLVSSIFLMSKSALFHVHAIYLLLKKKMKNGLSICKLSVHLTPIEVI